MSLAQGYAAPLYIKSELIMKQDAVTPLNH